jgi:DNA-binding transcriptional LysR family regulator
LEKGTLHIGCTLELSYAAHIQVFIQKFAELYPDIDVQTDILTTDWSAETLDSYDILMTSFELRNIPSNVHGKLIKSYGTYAVVYPGHKLLSKSHLQMQDLEGETIIVPYMQESFGPYARNWNLIKKQTHDRVNCLPVKDLPSALFQVSLHKGITIIPRYVKNMLPANSCIIWVSHQECRFHEYIYYKETMENGAAKLFYETFLAKN